MDGDIKMTSMLEPHPVIQTRSRRRVSLVSRPSGPSHDVSAPIVTPVIEDMEVHDSEVQVTPTSSDTKSKSKSSSPHTSREGADETAKIKRRSKKKNREIGDKSKLGKRRTSRKRDCDRAVCKVCGRTFRTFYLLTHMRTHSGEKVFACHEEGCRRRFSTECYLKMHIRSSHRDPQAFKCDICQRNLASKGSLREHMRTHSDERPFQCHLCYKVFRQPALLINHVKTHSASQKYMCELCGNNYKYKRSMEMHKERIHDGVRRSFPCQICDKIFTRKTKLKDHTNWHLGQSPHLCDHCGKRFLSRKTLRTHLLIHAELKPYPCDVCGKAFRQAHVLKRHLSTHTGIKPFKCEECQKQFIHRVYLIRHTCPRADRSLVSTSDVEEALKAGEAADVMASVMMHLPTT